MLARRLWRLFSTLRPSGFACQHGGFAADWQVSQSLRAKAEMLTSRLQGGVLTC
jgi:hypothetical protein